MKKTLLILIILVPLFFIAGAGYIYHLITAPNSPQPNEVTLRVDQGQSFKNTAAQLYANDLISSQEIFYYLGRVTGQAREVKAGHFQVNAAWSMLEMLEHLTHGQEALYRLQIPEGLTWWQIGRILESQGLADFDEFRELVNDQEFLRQHSIYGPTAEGFLFPETYYLSPTRDKGAERLVSIFINQFWSSTRDLWGDMEFEKIYEMVNLASLIEKETGVSTERKIISGVFHNRMERRMLLQCDPTIIYGLGEEFEGRIRRSHLDDSKNPYNTYRRRGYPPTPICSPGLASIRAALEPDDHNYLYFVSKNDGSHHFSKNLQEHNRAVNKYQRSR